MRLPPILSQELIRLIRLLALSGKGKFLHYLRNPLIEGGYRSGQIKDSVLKLTERISMAIKDPASRQSIGYKTRLLISRALEETPAALGDAVIFLLEQSSLHPFVSADPEIIRLANTIGPQLYEFQKIQNEASTCQFEEALRNAPPEELTRAFEPVNLGGSVTRVELDHRTRALYTQIMVASRKDSLDYCRKLIAEYMIRYSDQEFYDEEGVGKIITALNKREEGFSRNLRDLIAVQLYYQITKGIAKGDLKSAIAAIRKYAFIFGGDNTVKFFFEIDRMERILYKIIKEKNLWDILKK